MALPLNTIKDFSLATCTGVFVGALDKIPFVESGAHTRFPASGDVLVWNNTDHPDDPIGAFYANQAGRYAYTSISSVNNELRGISTVNSQATLTDTTKSYKCLSTIFGSDWSDLKSIMDHFTVDGSGNLTVDTSLSVDGILTGFNLTEGPDLTISAGAITKTHSVHRIDTENAEATDDLVTVNGGVDGDILLISTVSMLRDVTVKRASGNLNTDGDFTLTSPRERIVLIYKSSESEWIEIARSTPLSGQNVRREPEAFQFTNAMFFGEKTIADGDTTPDLGTASYWITSNSSPTTITSLTNDDGHSVGSTIGVMKYIMAGDDNTTIQNNAEIVTKSGSDIVMSNEDVVCFHGTQVTPLINKWKQVW